MTAAVTADADPSRARLRKSTGCPLLALAAWFACAAAPGGAQPEAANAAGWRALAALPDPVGFGGMFAGVLQGRLVAGGGSQWDKPIWSGGRRLLSDRIFTLATPSAASWTLHPSRLPIKAGHFASAAAADAIYLAGGIGESGSLRSSFALLARGDDLTWTRLPDLPQPVVYAAGAIVGSRFYVIGGLREPSARMATSEVWSLGVGGRAGAGGWRREADLPDAGVFVAAAASDDSSLYVFGGMTFDPAGNYAPSARAYQLNPAVGKWQRLADLPEPRVGATSPCPLLPGNRIFVIGGYAEVFPGEAREHPGFSAQTLCYSIERQAWELGPVLPVTPVSDRDSPGDAGPSPMIGAAGVVWDDHVVVVSGEVRASVRSPMVLGGRASRMESLPLNKRRPAPRPTGAKAAR